MKKLFILVVLCISLLMGVVYAKDDTDTWTLIPEGSASDAAVVGEAKGHIWDTYNAAAANNSAGDAFASGVFSWDSIFKFFKYLAKTLSQIGLVVGAIMIIYAGYKYATGVFTGSADKGGKEAVKSAIYGVLIIIFSFAIMKLLISTFL